MPSRDKREAFRRLAESRTNECLETIRKIKNLSNRGNYEYTAEQVEKVFSTIREALEDAENKFSKLEETKGRFRL